MNTLPYDKILDGTKLKAFTDDKSCAKMVISLFDRAETLWEKEKMLVTSVFQSLHSSLSLKVWIVW